MKLYGFGLFVPVVALTTVSLSSCPIVRPPDDPIELNEGFETGLNAWGTGADVPADPNNPGQPVAWSIVASNQRANTGQQSARFSLDGRQDDGTIWLERQFNLDPATPYRVTLAFAFWSESESFNTLAKVAAYAGASRPDQEGDFNTTQAANQVAGWKQYAYTFNTTSAADGRLWIAVGISAVWETQLLYFLDDIDVTIEPR